MKFKIVSAGFNCDESQYFDLSNYYFGVTIQPYKYSKFLKRYFKKEKFTIEIVKHTIRSECFDLASNYIENHTKENIMKIIEEAVKYKYGITEEQLSRQIKSKDTNDKFKELIGLEFEINIKE